MPSFCTPKADHDSKALLLELNDLTPRMPTVNEQMAMAGSITTDFIAARFLLTPGRPYEQAVSSFSPYKDTQAVDHVAREAGRAIIGKARGNKRPSCIYVNNRLEENALKTIEAMLEDSRVV